MKSIEMPLIFQYYNLSFSLFISVCVGYEPVSDVLFFFFYFTSDVGVFFVCCCCSWTYLIAFVCRHSGATGNSSSNEKPFACPVPGCKKRYKNVNGIKYHSKNGHKKEGK